MSAYREQRHRETGFWAIVVSAIFATLTISILGYILFVIIAMSIQAVAIAPALLIFPVMMFTAKKYSDWMGFSKKQIIAFVVKSHVVIAMIFIVLSAVADLLN